MSSSDSEYPNGIPVSLYNQVADIKSLISVEFDISISDMDSMTRRPEGLLGRQLLHCVLRYVFNISLSKIAFITGCGHANVINSLKKISNIYDTEKFFKSRYDSFMEKCHKHYNTSRQLVIDKSSELQGLYDSEVNRKADTIFHKITTARATVEQIDALFTKLASLRAEIDAALNDFKNM